MDGAGRQAGWPDEKKPYLKFCLYKENRDSMVAVSMLSRFTDLSSKFFAYAGTKDKRAVTTQVSSTSVVRSQSHPRH